MPILSGGRGGDKKKKHPSRGDAGAHQVPAQPQQPVRTGEDVSHAPRTAGARRRQAEFEAYRSRTALRPHESTAVDPVAAAYEKKAELRAQRYAQEQAKTAFSELSRRAEDTTEEEPKRKEKPLDPQHYGDSDTELLLNSLGYTGNGTKEFNQDVERLDAAYQELFGRPLTAAGMLDLIKSPAVKNRKSLEALLGGAAGEEIDPYGMARVQSIRAGIPVAPRTNDQRRMESYRRALAYALQQGNIAAIRTVVDQAMRQRQVVNAFTSIREGVRPHTDDAVLTAVQVSSVMPISMEDAEKVIGIGFFAKNYGANLSESNTLEENKRLLESSTAKDRPDSHGVHLLRNADAMSALEITADFQRKMIDTFDLDPKLGTSGIISSDWADVISRMQSNQAYALITQAQGASDMGFGKEFDAYNAVDMDTGKWADNEDGHRAAEAIQRRDSALANREFAIKNSVAARRIYESLPLQVFDQGGKTEWMPSASPTLGTLDYVFGGDHQGFGDFIEKDSGSDLGALAGTARNLGTGSWHIAEHALIRSVKVGFGLTDGVLQQTKSDLYAAGAFGWDPSKWAEERDEAGKRLNEINPTWLNVIMSDPKAREHLAGYINKAPLVGKPGSEKASLIADFASNIALDVAVTKRFGPIYGDFARYNRIKNSGRFGEAAISEIMVNPYHRKNGLDFFDSVREGRMGDAEQRLHAPLTGSEFMGGRRFTETGEEVLPFDPLSLRNDADIEDLLRVDDVEAHSAGPYPVYKDPVERAPGGANAEPTPTDLSQWHEDLGKYSDELSAEMTKLHTGQTDTPRTAFEDQARQNLAKRGIEEPSAPGSSLPEQPISTLQDRMPASYVNLPAPWKGAASKTDEGAVRAGGEWDPKAPTGDVGNEGARVQIHALPSGGQRVIIRRRMPIEEGKAERRADIREEDVMSEIKANISADGTTAAVDDAVVRESMRRKGFGLKAYHDLLQALETMGVTRLVRDVGQSKEARGLWWNKFQKGEGLPRNWEYVSQNQLADELWNRSTGFSKTLEDGGNDVVAVSRDTDLGYLRVKGSESPEAIRDNVNMRKAEAAAARQEMLNQPLPEPEQNLFSMMELIQSGKIDFDTFYSHYAKEAANGNILHTWRSSTVPYSAKGLLAPRRKGSILPAFHPFAFTKDAVWQWTARAFDKVDATYLNDPGVMGAGGLLRRVTRELRIQFTRAGNYHKLPVTGTEPKNIFRLAMKAGLSADHARELERRFIMGRANKDPALIVDVGKVIGEAARQGKKDSVAGAVEKIWGVTLNEKGEIEALSQWGELERAIKESNDPEEIAILTEWQKTASVDPSPVLPEELMHNFEIPEFNLPADRNGVFGQLQYMNDALLKVAAINRRAILVTDPILFWKHAFADTARRVIAQGGVKQWQKSRAAHSQFDEMLAANPQRAGIFNQMLNQTKNGELRFDVEMGRVGGGRSSADMFWTGDAVDEALARGVWGKLGVKKGGVSKRLMTAAAYIDRRLMSGATEAWQKGGREEVENFFENTRAGRAVVEQERIPAGVLARMVEENLITINRADPSFLDDAARVRNKALADGTDTRKALGKWLVKERRNVPVSGHVSEEDMFDLSRRSLDEVSSNIVGAYLTMNKWNRGGLFKDMAAMNYKNFLASGATDEQAFTAALGVARATNRYHMLDLGDALQLEQTFRWGSYFATKHRLYWTWLGQTMVRRPHLAIALARVQESLEAHAEPDDPSTVGKLSFYLPDFVTGLTGTSPAGGRLKYTFPVQRMFWLAEYQNMPGALSLAAQAISQGNWEHAIPFTRDSATELTTIDSGLRMLWLNTDLRLGRVNTSDTVETYLSEQERYKYRQVYNRIQFAYMRANNGRPMREDDAAAKATQHMMITSIWRGLGFTAGYVDDEARSEEDSKWWKAYNDAIDPAERERLREEHPEIEAMLGVAYSSADQHTKSQMLFTRLNDVMTVHENRQDVLMRKFKMTGSPDFLFGQGWQKESDDYQKEFEKLKAKAREIGASDWLDAMDRDHFLQAHVKFDAALHDIYPGMDQTTIDRVVAQERPGWVDRYETALDTELTDEAIKALPEYLREGQYQKRSFYNAELAAYRNEPDTEAGQLRRDYFDTAYDSYHDELSGLYDQIDKTPKDLQGNLFDKILAVKQKWDKPVMVNGIEFPSPERVHYALLPKEVQAETDNRNAWKQWGWLTPFEKQRLGVKVKPSVSQGWSAYNASLNAFEKQASVKGTFPYMTYEERLVLARKIDNKHPGFFKDYTYGMIPAYVRMQKYHTVGNTRSQKGWQQFFDKMDEMATDLTGFTPPPVNRPDLLLEWNAMFRKTIFSTLMSRGLPGVDGGRPAGGSSGWLYREASKINNPVFQSEFQEMFESDPEFLESLFSPGG